MAKTAAERVKESELRKLARGLVRAWVWIHPDDRPRLRKYVTGLRKKRGL